MKTVYIKEKVKSKTREQKCNTKPETLYPYMTNCHASTEEADIENHFLVNCPVVDDVNAFRTK